MAVKKVNPKRKQKREKLPLFQRIDELEKIMTTAKRNNKSLKGGGHYAIKFSEKRAEVLAEERRISDRLKSHQDFGSSFISDFNGLVKDTIDLNKTKKDRGTAKNSLVTIYKEKIEHKLDGRPEDHASDSLFPAELTDGTRPYIEKIGLQARGAYDKGWYDASAVMCRRLLETLIIECFEKHGISQNIQDGNGDFFYLRDLITNFLSESSWNVSRNSKKALPKLKDIGDKSAHSRWFTARKSDLEKLIPHLRTVIEELLHISNLIK